MTEPILRADGLTKYYDTAGGFIESLLGHSRQVKAVDDVSFELYEGETLGVVGESGCGKTTLGRSLIRLIEPTGGSVYYDGRDLTEISSSELRELRKEIQYIFQDPFSSLNPRMTVGDIIGEPLDIHDIAEGPERTDRIYELLEIVGLNPSHTHRYPHEFSGGQRQRIGIARALAVDPDIIICDEPVSALDVSVQAQILNLLEDLQDEFGLSYIFIAHDLSVVEHISDRVAVMYLGEFAEIGTTEDVFSPPHHPYTEALLSAIPEPDPLWDGDQILLAGDVPSPIDPPSGCRFHTRCPRIVQSAAFDVEQTVWRSIMDFKHRLDGADEIESITATDDGNGNDTERTDPTAVPIETLDRLVREEFDIPDRVSDPGVERVLAAVVERLYEGNVAEARELVQESFHSPCEATDPELLSTGGTHRIACLLYGDRHEDGGSRTSGDEGGGVRSTEDGSDNAIADD